MGVHKVLTEAGEKLALLLERSRLDERRDPTPGDDADAGSDVGTLWFNREPGCMRAWLSLRAAPAKAEWVYLGHAVGGSDPDGWEQAALSVDLEPLIRQAKELADQMHAQTQTLTALDERIAREIAALDNRLRSVETAAEPATQPAGDHG